jgi:hypothetical protein
MIHDVRLELDTTSTGRVTLDGIPLSVVALKIDAEVGKPPLVTFTVRASVHGHVEGRALTAGDDIRPGDAVSVTEDGVVRLWRA